MRQERNVQNFSYWDAEFWRVTCYNDFHEWNKILVPIGSTKFLAYMFSDVPAGRGRIMLDACCGDVSRWRHRLIVRHDNPARYRCRSQVLCSWSFESPSLRRISEKKKNVGLALVALVCPVGGLMWMAIASDRVSRFNFSPHS